MNARFVSLLSQIYTGWTEADWQRFRRNAQFPNLLTTLHEAAHWLQRQTLLERALHLVTIRSLLENEARHRGSNEQLSKSSPVVGLSPRSRRGWPYTHNSTIFRPIST
jgi:hypothetical protein